MDRLRKSPCLIFRTWKFQISRPCPAEVSGYDAVPVACVCSSGYYRAFAALVLLLPASSLLQASGVCPSDKPVNIKAPHANVWTPLSERDTVDVEKWLYKQKGLNLTHFSKAGLSDNSIWLIEAILPNKTDVLPFLNGHGKRRRSDNPLTVLDRANDIPAPKRYARAILFKGGLSIPVIKELQVGPLPISSSTKAIPYSYPYQNSTVPGVEREGNFPFNSRTSYDIELNALDAFILKFMTKIKAVTRDLLGSAYTGAASDKITYAWQGPNSYDGSSRRYWLWFTGNGNGGLYLAPTGFFVLIDNSGTDANKWYVRRIVYNHQIYQSLDEFYNSWKNGTVIPGVKAELGDKTKWADRNRKGPARPLDDREAPFTATIDGSRIRSDREAGYVEWMDWSFWIGFNRDTGLTLWDISFKGERIIYELSIQEAVAQYGGNDPVQSSTAYLDRHYGIGEETRQLLEGYDCPIGALTLNTSYYTDGQFFTSPGTICIFEHDLPFPTSRHADTSNNWYGSTKGTALHIHSMAADNYDYLLSYILYLEGTVEVLMGASGYLQATYWDESQNAWGTRIQKTTMGSVHTHVINYKVDLDIVGTANSVQTINLFTEEISPPYFDPEDGPIKQLRLNRTWVPTESSFSNNNNGQTVLLVGNKEAKNEWGLERMYRIMPGYHAVHNAIQGSKILLNNARWGEDDIYIVQHKDTEPSSSTTWNQQLPVTPPVDFSKFHTPAESIDQEDLVIYVNLGMHHVPRAEDTPNTLFTDTRSSFIVAPFNYFNEEPSRDIRNAILIAQNDISGNYEVEEAGSGDDFKQCLLVKDPATAYVGELSTETDSVKSPSS